MKKKQLRQRGEIENVDLTSDASEKFLAMSTKQEPLRSLSSSSRSSTAAELFCRKSIKSLILQKKKKKIK